MNIALAATVILGSSLVVSCGGAVESPPDDPSKGASNSAAPASARSTASTPTKRTDQGWASASVKLSSPPDRKATVRVDSYDGTGGDAKYCNDVLQSTPKNIGTANAVSGTVRFTLSTATDQYGRYSIDVALEGVVVKSDDGTTEVIPDAKYTDVGVGWLPG